MINKLLNDWFMYIFKYMGQRLDIWIQFEKWYLAIAVTIPKAELIFVNDFFFVPCLGHGFVCVYVCVYVCETDLDRPMTHQNRKRESKVVQQLHCPQSIWCLQWTQVLSTAEVTATYTHTHPQIYTNTHTYTHRASECRSTARPQAKSHCTGT